MFSEAEKAFDNKLFNNFAYAVEESKDPVSLR